MTGGNSYVFRCSLVAALGGLLFGFDTAVISGTIDSVRSVFDLSPGGLGFTVASALLGTIAGAICVGWPTDRIGRRDMLKILAVLYFISAIGSGLAWDWHSFMVFRFIGGLGVGGASVVSPMYIAEISPPAKRGRLVALAQFNIVLGILLAFISNFIIASLKLGGTEWRWMFGVEAIPAALFFFLLFGNPLSPRWLVAKGRKDEALDVLLALESDEAVAKKECHDIEESLQAELGGHVEPFYRMKYIKPILLAILITAFNQLSGINAVLYYATNIFKMTGLGESAALLSSIGVGLVNLVFTMVALVVIDKMGRKKLMLVGSLGYIISLGMCSWAFFSYAPQFDLASKSIAASETVGGMIAAEQPADQAFIGLINESVAAANAGQNFDLENPPTFKLIKSLKGDARAAAEKKRAELDTLEKIAAFVASAKAYQDDFVMPGVTSLEDVQQVMTETGSQASRASRAGGLTVLFCIFGFIASHAFGQGAVVWVFISEIFPNSVRARGIALGSFSIWIFNALVSQIFPMMVVPLGGGVIFAAFCICMVLQLLWVLFVMPETKGVPLEEINAKLGIAN